jgi:hypothetical protein
MAARAPTTPATYVNTGKLQPKQTVIYPPADSAISDQHFTLNRRVCLLSDFFGVNKRITSAAATWTVAGRYYIHGQHRCGTKSPATETGVAYIFAYNDVGDTDDEVGIYKSSTGTYEHVNVLADPSWCGPISLDFLPTDGTEMEIIVAGNRASGVNVLHIAGVVIYSA